MTSICRMTSMQTFFRACALVLLMPAAGVAGQERPHERLRVPAQGEWAERGRASISANVRTMQGAGDVMEMGGARMQGASVEGVMGQVVLPVAFPGEPFRFSGAEVRERFYGGGGEGAYSVSTYYREVSLGRFEVEGTVLPTVPLSHPSAVYVGERDLGRYNGVADSLAIFVREVLTRADSVTDWSEFVGEDARLPAVVILTAGQGGQCPGDRGHVWPHRWHLTGLLGAPFRTGSVTTSGDTVLIDDYIVQGVEACGSGRIDDAGIIVHETGHLLGLPDLYDTSDPAARSPVGDWGLMATGNYNEPTAPAHLGAWSRSFLGWADVRLVEHLEEQELALHPVETTGDVLWLPFRESGEHYLLEHRAPIGSDVHLYRQGLLIWYVNPDVVEQGLSGNTVNIDLGRPGVALVQADGAREMERGVNRGDEGDPWPGSRARTTFGRTTQPAARSPLDGRAAGLRLEDIALEQEEGRVRFRVLAVDSEPPAIEPDSLPLLAEGAQVEVSFVLALPGAADGDAWSVADPDGLAERGLALTTQGVLHGRLEGRGNLSLVVQAEAVTASGKATVSRAYEARVLPLPAMDASVVVDALLTGEPLSPMIGQYLDVVGNGDGAFDLGDLVRAVRDGVLTLPRPQAERLPPAPGAER